ncbi:hypothetical protein A943_09755 [Bacillus sp. CPSM8]|nr:hypothetical protein A943_09755 [Bacillus sp. CPSM8]KUL17914.1 hypothetical protein LI6934_08470 [Bacillus licheniformis LMG 6934]
MFVQEPLKGLMNMYGGSSVLILQRKKKSFPRATKNHPTRCLRASLR